MHRGQQNKRGDPPIFFRTPPRGGVRKKKWGAKRKGGARTPRTPPEYAPACLISHKLPIKKKLLNGYKEGTPEN